MKTCQAFTCSILLLFIIISCTGNKKIPFEFSYEKSNQIFDMKNVKYLFPDVCKPYFGEVVLLYDENGVFFEDTVYTLGMIGSLNCYLYNKFGNETDDEDSLRNLITHDFNYIYAISKIENVSRLNYLLKNKYKIMQWPSDSIQMENLIRLILDAQFNKKIDKEKYLYINTRKSWNEILNKYNGIDLSDTIILSSLRPTELLSIKNIREVINDEKYYNSRYLLFYFNSTYDNDTNWSGYYDIIICYELYLDMEGYLQLRKNIENIFFLLKPFTIE